jgi:hypothetical protein
MKILRKASIFSKLGSCDFRSTSIRFNRRSIALFQLVAFKHRLWIDPLRIADRAYFVVFAML